MPNRTRKIKEESEKFEDDEEFAEAMQSQGSVVSELPSRYRKGTGGAGSFIGPIILFLAIVVGGYLAYGFLTRPDTTSTTNITNQSQEQEATPPVVETPNDIVAPAGDAPIDADINPATITTPLTVEVRNGSGTAGLAKRVADTLAEDKAYTIAKVGNAGSSAFTTTQVVVIGRGVSSATAATLAEKLNGEVVLELPEGEAASTADVVVILGKDQAL